MVFQHQPLGTKRVKGYGGWNAANVGFHLFEPNEIPIHLGGGIRAPAFRDRECGDVGWLEYI